MPQPTKGPRLGGGPAHERLLLANLAKSLFEHGRITTTEAKARRLRPLAERLITKAKRGDLHSRRQIISSLRGHGDYTKDIVFKLMDEIGPRFANRPGGYTRIVKLGPRRGDNAPMALIELVEPLTVAQEAVGEAEAATRRSVKEQEEAAATPATTEDDATEAEIAEEGATEAETEAEEPSDEEPQDAGPEDGDAKS